MRTALASFLAAGLITLAGCSTNPSTGRKQLILVGSDQTTAMGEAAKPELTEQYGGPVQSSQLRNYVTTVGKRLAAQTEPEYKNIKWEFTTLDSDVINAFSLPGGKIFITRGLLSKFHDEAQVAGVLGHEIGHVTAKHVDERISQATVVQTGAQLGGQLSQSQIASLGLQLFGQGYLLKFSRQQESEADSQGLKYMTRAGYSPQGMVEVLQVLADESKSGRQPEILSTHPDPEKRLQDVESQIAKQYADAAHNTTKYQLYPDRFERGAAPYLDVSVSRPKKK